MAVLALAFKFRLVPVGPVKMLPEPPPVPEANPPCKAAQWIYFTQITRRYLLHLIVVKVPKSS